MKHADFNIGSLFWTETDEWRCTDVGSRTVIAIRVKNGTDISWYDGPPYAVVEQVFDEDDLYSCFISLQEVEVFRDQTLQRSDKFEYSEQTIRKEFIFSQDWESMDPDVIDSMIDETTDQNKPDRIRRRI